MQEKRRFEESWKDAFDGAEMAPPEHVWVNVELDLAGAESQRMKKRVIFYQRLAAGLLIVSASLGVYVWNTSDQNQDIAEVRQGTPENKNNTTEQSTPQKQGDAPAALEERNALSPNETSSSNGRFTARGNKQTTSTVTLKGITTQNASSKFINSIALNDSSNDLASTFTETQEVDLPSVQVAQLQSDIDVTNSTDSVTQMSTEEALKILNAYVNPEEEKKQDKTKSAEMLWLAMGGAAGSYNPRAVSAAGTFASSDALLDKTSLANSQAGVPSETNQHSTGTAYSVGVSVGTKVGKRWIVQSGLNYIHQQIDYTSNVRAITSSNQSRLVTAEYLNAEVAGSVESLTATSPYTINSAMEFVSIPVQAGYLIVDRRVGWQVNTGVSTDIFMRNTLVDESGRIEKFSQSAGNESPYRTINWSGLFNTEVSYRLSKNYRVAVVPGMRYSITSILKDAVSTPLILDVGFRFRYMFVD
ncbi:MAG: outer membrane beta-barrel protein [Bacteroidota bacterium]